MKLLSKIMSGKQPACRRVMVYGTHGIGKSTFGSMSVSPIFIQTEDGLGEIDCDRFPLASSLDQVIQSLAELYTEKHDYKTVVLDSLDWLERLIWADVCNKNRVENIEDIPYARGYSLALTQWRKVLDGFDALRNKKSMTTIFIAHAKIERFNNPETESYDRYVPQLHKSASALIQEWCDEVLFATYKIYTKQSDEGFGKTRTQGISDGSRILRTTERPSHVAKNRLNLPDELLLDWREYAKYFTNTTPCVAENKNEGEPQWLI